MPIHVIYFAYAKSILTYVIFILPTLMLNALYLYLTILLGSSMWNILSSPFEAEKPHPASLIRKDKLSSLAPVAADVA